MGKPISNGREGKKSRETRFHVLCVLTSGAFVATLNWQWPHSLLEWLWLKGLPVHYEVSVPGVGDWIDWIMFPVTGGLAGMIGGLLVFCLRPLKEKISLVGAGACLIGIVCIFYLMSGLVSSQAVGRENIWFVYGAAFDSFCMMHCLFVGGVTSAILWGIRQGLRSVGERCYTILVLVALVLVVSGFALTGMPYLVFPSHFTGDPALKAVHYYAQAQGWQRYTLEQKISRNEFGTTVLVHFSNGDILTCECPAWFGWNVPEWVRTSITCEPTDN